MTYKQLIFLFVLTFTSYSFAQSRDEAAQALDQINSVNDINKLKEKFPHWVIVQQKNAEFGMSYDSILVEAKVGDTLTRRDPKSGRTTLDKIVQKEKEELCNVQYIYIDGRNRPKEKVKSLQKMIISQYRSGKSFTSLNEKFSEDANPTGILNWFYKGMMLEEFDKAVRGKPANNVFTIDIPAYNWYYVVLKKEEDKEAEVTTSVSILITE